MIYIYFLQTNKKSPTLKVLCVGKTFLCRTLQYIPGDRVHPIAEVKNVSRSAMESQLLRDLDTFFPVASAPWKNTRSDDGD